MPFTQDELLKLFRTYNEAVWPTQVLLIILGSVAAASLFTRWRYRDRFITGILAFLWGWTGTVYYIAFFSRINAAAKVFGIICLVQAVLLIVYGSILGRMKFLLRMNLRTMIGLGMLLYAMIIYPILGSMFGHSYPYLPTFGTPCPVTIFTFGMLFMLQHRIPAAVYAVPLLWSLIGGSAAVLFGIPEDFGLIGAGLAALILLFLEFAGRNRQGETPVAPSEHDQGVKYD